MLIHPMVERLRGLGLAAMADAFTEMQRSSAADDLSREDWLGLLIDREATERDGKRLKRRLTQARLRQNAVIEDIDLRTPRGLDRGLFHKLAACGWIRDSQHLLIVGPTGVGKSWLACALGNKACRDGFSVMYRRAPSAVCRSRDRTRGRSAETADDDAGANASAHHRRLGPGAADGRAAAGSTGDHRRS